MTNYNEEFNKLVFAITEQLEGNLPEDFKGDAKQILFMRLCTKIEDLSYAMESDVVTKNWIKDFDESRQPDGALY